MQKLLKKSFWKKLRVRSSRRSEQGFSLMELLISTSITVGVMTMSAQLLNQSQQLFQKQSARTAAQSRGRKVINMITADVRATGVMPVVVQSGVIPGLADARVDTLRIVGDRKGDSSSNLTSGTDANDDISYAISNGKLYRNAPNDPDFGNAVMASDVAALSFRYYDAASNEFTPPTGDTLPATERGNVARIDVSVTINIVENDKVTGKITVASPIALRSRIMDGY